MLKNQFSHGQFLEGVERDVFWRWVSTRRWFGGKARCVAKWEITAMGKADDACIAELAVTYADGQETYAVPLAWVAEKDVQGAIATHAGRALCDATALPSFRAWIFRQLEPRSNSERFFPNGCIPDSKTLDFEQSNTSIIYGGKLFLKLYRRLVQGVNPDAELTRYLSEVARFPNTPAFAGEVKWRGAALALAVSHTPNEGDAWPLALTAAREFYATGQIGTWLERVELLGKRTGELHSALSLATSPDFAPEPFTAQDLDALARSTAELEASTRAALAMRLDSFQPNVAALAQNYLSHPRSLFSANLPHGVIRMRTHGDYHLGQVLWTGEDFVIIDFEGEPSRPLAERRAKRSPLRDVAGMLRSFHYAAHAASNSETDATEQWAARSQAAFLGAWKNAAPSLTAGLELLPLFAREKAIYELAYELNNRPDWIGIPLRALG